MSELRLPPCSVCGSESTTRSEGGDIYVFHPCECNKRLDTPNPDVVEAVAGSLCDWFERTQSPHNEDFPVVCSFHGFTEGTADG